MADPLLQSMLVHTADVYHHGQAAAVDGQLLEDYPAAPDIEGMAGLFAFDGQTLTASPVGYLIESDAVFYCENADLRELDKVVWTDGGGRVFVVNGTPSEYPNPWGTNPDVPHLLEIGLRERKRSPA